MLEIDGARHSGSGRLSGKPSPSLTGQAVHLRHVRVRRPNPGLRPQHLQVVEAIRQLVDGTTEGVRRGTQEFVFIPGLPHQRLAMSAQKVFTAAGYAAAIETLAEKETGVTFDDVAGQDEAKEELLEIIEFLKNPKKFQALGGKLPRGGCSWGLRALARHSSAKP